MDDLVDLADRLAAYPPPSTDLPAGLRSSDNGQAKLKGEKKGALSSGVLTVTDVSLAIPVRGPHKNAHLSLGCTTLEMKLNPKWV